jgi:hypothetical protein
MNMNSEQIFWINVWKIAAACVITLVVVIGGCTTTERLLISHAISNGADPITARCGIVGQNEREAVLCYSVTQEKK